MNKYISENSVKSMCYWINKAHEMFITKEINNSCGEEFSQLWFISNGYSVTLTQKNTQDGFEYNITLSSGLLGSNKEIDREKLTGDSVMETLSEIKGIVTREIK